MSRRLTPSSTLENLRREAKRWLRALRVGDAAARARLEAAIPEAPPDPGLRDVQRALAREHGFPGWTDLKREVEAIESRRGGGARESATAELIRACWDGDTERVAAILDEHPDIIDERIVMPGHDGRRTALHHALAHEPVVRLLLARGADPNIRDEGDDATPLHFAAERGDMAVVRLLVEHGADTIGEGTFHELNVLGWAVCWDYAHNQEVAEYLLAHGARHTIHTAVALGDVEAIREHAADLERPMDRTNHRRRPLHLAVIKKRRDSLATLLELGADTEAEDAGGLTALDHAALGGEADMVGALLEAGAELRLPAAIALGRLDDVERLLREEPGALGPAGAHATLLVRAAVGASGEIVRALIRAGADPNVRDRPDTAVDQAAGFTPLHAAAFAGNMEAVDALLEHGADPTVRETKWRSTAAGWAAHAGHERVRDVILEAGIDPFQAIDFDRPDRIPAIVRQSPWLLEKPFREYLETEPAPDQWYPEPWHTPLIWAVVENKPDAVRALLSEGAAQPLPPGAGGRTLAQVAEEAGHAEVAELLRSGLRVEETHEGRVRWFVKNACPDHDIRGPRAHVTARETAARLLRAHPEIAQDGFWTAIICGELDLVQRMLAERPGLAKEKGGPKGWEPLLYLCFTRLPSVPAASENAVAVARLLLDHGADPNAFFMAGDSRYTPLVGAAGEGEESRPPHPRRDELVDLLLERGAEPYDIQVLYDIHFRGELLWFLERIHRRAIELGRGADWEDPEWHMLDMGGYGGGARYVLDIAVRRNDLALAEWCLEHGADPDAAHAADARLPQRLLHTEAVRLGHRELAELLVRYGAEPTPPEPDPEADFVAACLAGDEARARSLAEAYPEHLRSPRAIFAAAKEDRPDIVRLLLELGTPVEVEDEQAQRPLHVAAYHDAVEVARLLIERGAEVDPVERRFGNTPLDFAVYAQHARMIDILAPRSRDLWNLVYAGKVERVRELLDDEPELARLRAEGGATPLMWLPEDAAAAAELARLFLGHGADASPRDRNGLTAGDHAARRGLREAAALLRAAN